MPHTLTNLKITRVALVDKGANQHAHIMLFKADSMAAVHSDKPLSEEEVRRRAEARAALDSALQSKEKRMKPSLLKRLVAAMGITDVAKKDLELAAIVKEVDDTEDVDKMAHIPGDKNCKCADCLKKVDDDKDLGKRASAEVIELKKSLDAMEKRTKDAEDRAKTAEDVAKAERTIRKRADMVTLLKSFRAVPLTLEAKEGETSDVDRYLKMQELDPAGFDRTIALLKAADGQIAEGAMFANLGRTGSGGGGTAWEQIEAKAEQMLEKSNGSLTKEAAIDKVMDANPKLVKQYRAEQQ